MEELRRLEIQKMFTQVATEWNRRQVKAEKGENVICDALEEIGYSIKRYPMRAEGDEITIKRKEEKLKLPRFPDASAMYTRDDKPPFGNYFFFDSKFKSKSESLGLVNKLDYDGYFKFIRYGSVLVDVKIFFYIHETKQIWVHNLRDPTQEPSLDTTIEIMQYGREVYRIFDSELTRWTSVLYTEK